MTNKEIQLLYLIFEYELIPPFKFVWSDDSSPVVCNKFLEEIGYYSNRRNNFHILNPRSQSIIRKIESIYNLHKLSDDDATIISKYLFEWILSRFPMKLNAVIFENTNTTNTIFYP